MLRPVDIDAFLSAARGCGGVFQEPGVESDAGFLAYCCGASVPDLGLTLNMAGQAIPHCSVDISLISCTATGMQLAKWDSMTVFAGAPGRWWDE